MAKEIRIETRLFKIKPGGDVTEVKADEIIDKARKIDPDDAAEGTRKIAKLPKNTKMDDVINAGGEDINNIVSE